MNDKNFYCKQNKKKLKKYVRNCHYSRNDKAKSEEYYENNKEMLQEQAPNSYRNFSGEKKTKKKKHGRNRCESISKEDKQELKEYGKRCRNARKMALDGTIKNQNLSSIVTKR